MPLHAFPVPNARRAQLFAVFAACSTLYGCGGENATGAVAADGTLIEEPDRPTTRIEVKGADGKLDKDIIANVAGFLSAARETCDAPEWRLERRVQRAPEEAASSLRALGYYGSESSAEVTKADDCWAVVVTVRPGEPVRIAGVEVDVTGAAASDPAFARLRDSLPVNVGDQLNHGNYESAKASLDSLAAERGYFDAKFTISELRVDPAVGQAVVALAMDSGPRYDFGELKLEQDALTDDLALRIARFPTGEPYSADRLNGVNGRLANSGYFDSVLLAPDTDARADGVVNASATAVPRPAHRYIIGAGFTTDEGPRLRLGYENRRINKRGHRFRSDLRASLVEQSFSTQYTIPLADPTEESLTFEAGARRLDNDEIETLSGRVGARHTARRFGDWRETISLFYSVDNFQIGNDSGNVALLVPGVTYSLTRADKPLRPDRGYKVLAGVRLAAEPLLSDVTFVHAMLELTGVYSLTGKDRLLARTNVGAVVTDAFHELPPEHRFFAGGDTSVRGYGFQDLSPEDSDGDVIGGEYLGTVSFEYEHAFTPAWSGAAFVDSGAAFNNSLESGGGIGVGVGVRWQSPVGPVRVDVAHPVNNSDDVVRLHLRLGPDL